jgi:RHS repeat-associated protein
VRRHRRLGFVVFIIAVLLIEAAHPPGITASPRPTPLLGANDSPAAVPPDPRMNVLRGLTDSSLKASGVASSSLGKSKAIDGDVGTRWSPPDNQGPSAGHYWAADLGASRPALRFRLVTRAPSPTGDFASTVDVYGSNEAGAWSWLPAGKIAGDPAANGWSRVGGYAGLAFPIDTGQKPFGVASTYRYWLFRAVAGGSGTDDEFDINEVELWGDLPGDQLFGLCGSGHGNTPAGCEADPVNTATGNYATQATDLSLPGRGLGFSFVRTYNSLNNYVAPGGSPNLVRFPVAGTASYSASRIYSSNFTAADAADGITGNSDANGMSWAVNNWVSGDWWQTTWSQPQALNRIDLCDRRAAGWYFGGAGRITFSDGSTVNWSGLPDDCTSTGANTLSVRFARKTGITWFRVIGDSGGTGNAGLAEVEAYDAAPSLGSGAPDSPNLARFPIASTSSYSASRIYSGNFTAADAADGITGNSDANGMSWAVNTWQSGDWWQVSWSQPQALNRIELCDRRTAGWYFGSAGRITFSDGSTVNWSGLPDDCGPAGAYPLSVVFARKTGITWFRVIGDAGGTGNAGLAEVEAYDDAAPALGSGWTHSYAAQLDISDPQGSRRFFSEDGAQYVFQPDGSGGYVAPAATFSSLSTLPGGGYELVRRDQVRYLFGPDGRLQELADRNANALTFDYVAGDLTTITDSAGRTITLAYDERRLISVAAPPDRTVTYAYDTNGRLATVTEATGAVWQYSYDAYGRLETVTDPNQHVVVTNEYGADGRISAQTNATGDRGTFDWNAQTQTSTYTDADGGTWLSVYANNVLQSSTDPLGNIVSYAYDTDLNLAAVTDPRGNVTTFSYDDRGNRTSRTAPAPLSYVQTWTYNNRNDVATYVDGRGNQTTFTYDAAGNLISTTAPLSSVTSFGRDPTGTGLLVSLTDPRGKVTTFGYDTAANLNQISTPLGNVTTKTYDTAGRLLTNVDPRGNVVGADPAQYKTSYTYDAGDHVLTATDALGNVTSFTYDDVGNPASVTDANNHTTAFVYDATNHLASVTDATNGVTSYTYDDVGNLVSRTDAKNHVTTYAYDLAKRLTSTTDPLSHVWSLTYDAAGNIATRTDANNKATTFGYDALNRLTTVTYADSSTATVTNAYDANGNRVSMIDGAGTETYAFDALNRLTTVTRGTVIFSYGYDAAGNVTSRTYPGQSAQPFVYDDDGRLSTANGATYGYDAAANLLNAATPDGLTARYAYDRAGRLLEVAHTTASATLSRFTYALDGIGNRKAMTTRQGTVTYRYDELSRLTEACWSQTTCPGGAPATPLTCLTCIGGLLSRPSATISPPPGETYRTYTYDPVGNRLSEASDLGSTTYAYDVADRLTTVTAPGPVVTNYAFDNNGNQTAAGSVTFTYDLANRLKTATVGATTETYTSAGDGVRLSASTGSGASQTTKFLWDRNFGLPQVAMERDGNDALLRDYRFGLDLLRQTAGSTSYYYHHDGLGSVADVTSSAGTSLTWDEYYPYGIVRQAGTGAGAPAAQPFMFAGEQLDAVTGFYHLRARQYDPTIGRFLSVDPAAARMRDPYVSSYVYVKDDPASFVDPSGRDVKGTCFTIEGAAAIWFGEGALCHVTSDSGQSGIILIVGGGGGPGVAVGSGVSSIHSDAAEIYDLEGPFAIVGGSAGLGGGLQGEFFAGRGHCSQVVTGEMAGIFVGAGGSAQGGVSVTKVLIGLGPPKSTCPK